MGKNKFKKKPGANLGMYFSRYLIVMSLINACFAVLYNLIKFRLASTGYWQEYQFDTPDTG